MRMEVMHPPAPGGRANSGCAPCRDGAVERVKQRATATMCRPIIHARQVEQRGVVEHGRRLHDPSFSAHRDTIARSKGHGCAMAMGIPWKIYRLCRPFSASTLSEWQ